MYDRIPIKYFLKNNLCVIGSSHIFKDIDIIIERIFNEFSPQYIALELDRTRYNLILNLIQNGKNSTVNQKFYSTLPSKSKKFHDKNKNNATILMNQIKKIQTDLGQQKGLTVGLEFLKIIELSSKNNIPVELIDISIEELIKKIQKIDSQKLSKLSQGFDKIDSTDFLKEIEELTNKLDDINYIKGITDNFRKENPELYNIFIEDRNHQMIQQVRQLIEKNPNKRILVLIGAAHLPFFVESFSL